MVYNMAKFEVKIYLETFIERTVEAENEEDACDKAYTALKNTPYKRFAREVVTNIYDEGDTETTEITTE